MKDSSRPPPVPPVELLNSVKPLLHWMVENGAPFLASQLGGTKQDPLAVFVLAIGPMALPLRVAVQGLSDIAEGDLMSVERDYPIDRDERERN